MSEEISRGDFFILVSKTPVFLYDSHDSLRTGAAEICFSSDSGNTHKFKKI
jgi:hypothetical protein